MVLKYLVSIGDAVSQLIGRLIWVRIRGKWQTWTRNSNESISGASFKRGRDDKIVWPQKAVDWLISPFEKNHCLNSYMADLRRAEEYIEAEGYLMIHPNELSELIAQAEARAFLRAMEKT